MQSDWLLRLALSLMEGRVFDSVERSPVFPALRPYLKIEKYGRDGGPDKPRRRIEIRGAVPEDLFAVLLATRVQCCACGHPIAPFRERQAPPKRGPSRHLYVAVACPLDVNIGCSRGAAAREAYLAIEAAHGDLS